MTGYDGPICAQHGEVDDCGPSRTVRQRDDACYCCGEVDDPNGKGPAINTGFCAECNSAGCPEALTGSLCKRVGSDMSGRVDEMARLGRWAMTGARPPYPDGDVPGCVAEICKDLHAQITELREAKAAANCCDESAALRLSLAQMDKINQSATTDGIATGLSRALVALEARAAKLDEHGIYPEHMEASRCAGIVRELLEATVDRHLGAPVEPLVPASSDAQVIEALKSEVARLQRELEQPINWPIQALTETNALRAKLAAALVEPRCHLPPPGWRCTRAMGHEGPCAAIPAIPATPATPDPWEALTGLLNAVSNVEDADLLATTLGGEKCGCDPEGYEHLCPLRELSTAQKSARRALAAHQRKDVP